MSKPYVEKILSEGIVIRGFSANTNNAELVWHRDREDRTITVIEGKDWYFQRDNYLPVLIKEGDIIKIKKEEWHRIIKGKTDLIIAIKKQ